jgi:uncharacterized protein YutE (UPF0331/DUF86 family)
MPNEIVLVRLEGIIKDLDEVSALLDGGYDEFLEDDRLITLAERWFERIVNRMIDINNFFIKDRGGSVSKTYFDSFIEVGKLGVLSVELAENLAPAAGARNILVHEYEDLDYEFFWKSLENIVKHGREYVKVIREEL